MEFVDTHCHIHFEDYDLKVDKVLENAKKAGVTKLVAVGCTVKDSTAGVQLAEAQEGVYAAVGIHPHHAKEYDGDKVALKELGMLAASEHTVAIGECGLDYYYEKSPKETQKVVFEEQLQIALDTDLPVSFHVRDAFEDFYPIIDNFPKIRGVVHSFTSGTKVLDKVLERGLYVGLNGILTFTKDQAQLAMAKAVPAESLLLETDAPFLTPEPNRDNVCEPKHVVDTARFLAELRSESLEEIASASSRNATKLFGLK